MKRTTLRMGPRGTVTLPKPLRVQYSMETHDLLLAEPTAEGILLRPAVALPIEIYSDARLAEFQKSELELDQSLARTPKLRSGLERAAAEFRRHSARSSPKKNRLAASAAPAR